MNKAFIIGELTTNPKMTKTADGTKKTFIEVEVEREFVQEGSDDKCDNFNVAFYGGYAEKAYEKLRKGDMVFVRGEMHSEQYEINGQEEIIWELAAEMYRAEKTSREEKEGEVLIRAELF